MISHVSAACTKNSCNLNDWGFFRVETFGHSFVQGWNYWQVFQYPVSEDKPGYNINITWQTYADTLNKQNYYSTLLVKNASKPKLWFSGDEYKDPILLMFETMRFDEL